MSEADESDLVQVLRLCAKAAPQPWYPRAFVRQTKNSKEGVSEIIEELLLDGLVERTSGSEETGPGLVLSPLGMKVLSDPAALQRLRQGRAVKHGDRGGVIREALRRDATPYVSRGLLGLNLLVFGYGAILAIGNHAAQAYLTGFSDGTAETRRRLEAVLQRCGSLSAELWLRGDWWRTITACFVHFGILHVALNMYMLYAVGAFVERMWGRGRFLLIYAISGMVGTCVGLAHNTDIYKLTDTDPPERLTVSLAGASAALCGILAATAVWIWLNGMYLPRSQAERWRSNMLLQAMLIVFISLFPGISGWGHFGGAAAGAITALLLHYQRFGQTPLRWVAAAALLPVPFLGFLEIQRMRHCQDDWTLNLRIVKIDISDKGWEDVEVLDYKKRFGNEILERWQEDQPRFHELVDPLLDMGAGRREELRAADVPPALACLAELRQRWSKSLDVVNQAGPYYQAAAKELQTDDRETIEGRLKLFELAEKCLQQGKQWTPAEETTLREQRRIVGETKPKDRAQRPSETDPEVKPAVRSEQAAFRREYLDRLIETSNAIAGVWDKVKYEAVKPPKDRVDKIVAARLEESMKLRQKLTALAEQLDKAGRYKDEQLETVRQTARDALKEWAKVLDEAERCLRDNAEWKGEEREEGARNLRTEMLEALRLAGFIN